MQRRPLALAAAVAAALALAGAPAAAEKIKIGFVSPSFDVSDVYERAYWSLSARLDELGIEHELQALAVASHVDHAGQLAQVESVIAAGADYIVLSPTDYDGAIPSVRAAKRAGVPVIVYNYAVPHEDESGRAMTYVGFAHDEGGRLSGAWAATHLNGKGKIAIIQGAPGLGNDQRRDGFLSVVSLFPNIEVILGTYTEFDRSKAYDAAQNLLTAHEDLDLIYGVSTSIGLGAAQAVRQAGKSDRIATMGFGGTMDEIVAMREGWFTASVLRPVDDSGVAVAETIAAHLKGEAVPQVWSGPFIMVDKDSDADAIVEYSNRYSKAKMGR